MNAENFNAVSQIIRRTEQCELPMQIAYTKLNFYDLAAGIICLHAIT